MPFDATRIPVMRAGVITDAGASLDFSLVGEMGAAYIQNLGPDDVWIAFDAVPANTTGNGRVQLKSDAALNLDDIGYLLVGARAIALGSATVEVTALRRPGAAGTGA